MKQIKTVKLALLLAIGLSGISGKSFAQWNPNPNYSVGTVSGMYNFDYNTIPSQLVEIVSPVYTNITLTYQWQTSTSPAFTSYSTIGSLTSYTFTAPLTQTTYFRRKTTDASNANNYIYSNIIELQLSSVNWENLNYIREHDVITTGITTDWKAVDQLTIGQKLQSTTYLDGLGRPVEKISKQTATPAQGSSTWGDMVQFSQYDVYGRQPKQFLPYTTTAATEAGKYKVAPTTDQAAYYTAVYSETSAFSNIVTYDNSPLNRVMKVNAPGASWAISNGNQAAYELNDATDNVQIFTIAYTTGSIPSDIGVYAANTLYKTTQIDENLKKVIEYTNQSGQLILKKVQIDDVPTASHSGWICTYNVYDDFGLLRYVLQPEAVKYLDANTWSFAGTNGQAILNEFCFRYEYDDKGRTVLKKAPGADPLNMVYDSRDRVVFMQDGNQAQKSPPEWTANLYDELDRVTITTLYRTTKTISQLQADIAAAVTVNTVTVTNSGEPITDLVVDTRNTSIVTYSARNSITFASDEGGSFASATNDNFTAQIDATAATPVVTVSVAVFSNPISATDLGDPLKNTILKYQFYDDYSFTGVKTFDNNFHNTTAYSTSDPNVIAIALSKRTLSFPTGSMVRVLGTNTFLNSTEYYDEKGRHIQTLEDNIKQGADITTMQYHWDGRLLSAYSSHSTAYSGYSSFGILTKNLFDNIGRITSVQKKYETGSNDFKTIASYDYDDMGRLKTKHLDPGYTGSGKNELEALTYSYNIHNEITGINKDYALKTPGKYDKWGNFFGFYLGYDDNTNFTIKQLDGHVTGQLWTTQGDDAQRKYDYTYDNAGRLASAVFKEKPKTTDVWDNSKMDFSVKGPTSSKIAYDLNGNLLSMIQKGVMPGSSAPVNIDNLTYTYSNYSNKLLKVVDGVITQNSGVSGDFKDGTNTGDDYVYDKNGNLTVDNNKGASISIYNFLDKPETITITGKGVIKIVYDAEGNKLQKIFTPQGGTAVTTTYINQFVYRDNTLQYINFEEGRIRVITPVSTSNGYDGLTIDGNIALPGSKEGVFDYFIRDYQENVRMILTEEIHNGSNKCTMESSRATAEEPVFGQTGAGNEVVKTRFAVGSIPGQSTGGGWQNALIGSSVSKLAKNSTQGMAGPNALLKVMAGDVINATTQYYYQNPVTNAAGTTTLTTDIINALLQVINGSTSTSSLVKGGSNNIGTQLTGNSGFGNITEPDVNNAGGTNPKAYLTIIFFDERFNYVSDGSISSRAFSADAGGSNASLTLANIKAPKNGYAYIYLSNESTEPVYFDNFNVGLNRGRIIEEDHYYAYGLKIAAISSQKLPDPNEGNIDNKNLYNDKELFDDADLDWYDYGFRNYDAQIGRFTQLDPLTWEYPELTNYQYASCEPIANIDMDGLEKASAVLNFSYSYTTESRLFLPGLQAGATKVVEKTAASGLNITSLTVNVTKIGVAISDNTRLAPRPILSFNNSPPQATIRTYTPGAMDNWSNSESFLGKATYSIADDIYVSVQLFRDRAYKQHLGGGHVNNNQAIKSFGNTLAYIMPIGGIETGTAEKVLATGSEKSIVIGEGMQVVKSTAKELQKQGINAKWYQAWGKNFPKNRLLTLEELAASLARNDRWINSKINQGYKIYDKGIDPTRLTRSPFYELEQSILKQRNYPVIKLPR
ncbi:MAG TPA: DUF6443 domain-containing protein [Panacibacter sp.]|nr:DUF6443 domain-containing protein [Panacibacter sp.]